MESQLLEGHVRLLKVHRLIFFFKSDYDIVYIPNQKRNLRLYRVFDESDFAQIWKLRKNYFAELLKLAIAQPSPIVVIFCAIFYTKLSFTSRFNVTLLRCQYILAPNTFHSLPMKMGRKQ